MVKLLIVILTFHVSLQAQSLDSLKTKLEKEKQDSSKIKLLSQLTELCEIKDILLYAEPLVLLTEKNYLQAKKDSYNYRFYLKHYADALGNIGYYYKYEGDVIKAVDYYSQCLSLKILAADTIGIALSYNNIGMLYTNLGDITKALNYFSKSLAAYESKKEIKGIALSLNNIAGIYEKQGEIQDAIDYYNKSLLLKESINDDAGIVTTLNNLSFLELKKGDTLRALEYGIKNLKSSEASGNKRAMAHALNTIGSIYLHQGRLELAFEKFQRSLVIREAISDKQGCAVTLCNLSKIYLKKESYIKAEEAATKSLQLSRELGYPELIGEAALTLKAIYLNSNKPKQALVMYELYIQMRDSLTNEHTRKSSIKSKLGYEFSKKEALLKEQQEKERLLASAHDQLQKIIIFSVVIGFLMVFLFSILIYNRLQITRTQKNIIEKQKLIVEEHRKEIVDSINYAKRIQFALLAGDSLLQKNLPEHFVLFKPKSVVSGDFYWAAPVKDAFVYVTADCTGHGVPGAFMSLLNISKLNQTIVENRITKPDFVLNEVRSEIIKALNPEGSVETSKDGMDAVVCKLDHKNMRLTYAAANNAFYIVRKGNLIICPADKMPVGMGHNDLSPFTLHEIVLESGDMIYTFTDGYADQFGGPKGKKFKYKAFEDLLLNVSNDTTDVQKIKLEKAFEDWKGIHEQVDDVCVIGVRV